MLVHRSAATCLLLLAISVQAVLASARRAAAPQHLPNTLWQLPLAFIHGCRPVMLCGPFCAPQLDAQQRWYGEPTLWERDDACGMWRPTPEPAATAAAAAEHANGPVVSLAALAAPAPTAVAAPLAEVVAFRGAGSDRTAPAGRGGDASGAAVQHAATDQVAAAMMAATSALAGLLGAAATAAAAAAVAPVAAAAAPAAAGRRAPAVGPEPGQQQMGKAADAVGASAALDGQALEARLRRALVNVEAAFPCAPVPAWPLVPAAAIC
jgi:hypothetical protein